MSALSVLDLPQTGRSLPPPRLLKDPVGPLLAVVALLQTLASTNTSVAAPGWEEWPTLVGDPAATGVWVGEIRVTVSPVEMLDEIKNISGLTWEQLGRTMGVSRRTIHLWLQGNALSPANEERLHGIIQIVRSLGGRSQLEVRSRMLDRSGGESVTDLLVAGDDAAASALALQRALSRAVPNVFDHGRSQSLGTLASRRLSLTAVDLLEAGTGPAQATPGQPKRVRRIRRGSADDK